MKKIAMLFPYAPKYREPIYQLMDKELDIDWFFCGNAVRDLNLMDYSILKNVNLDLSEEKVLHLFSRYMGIDKLHLEKYDVIICPGVVRCITDWWLLSKISKSLKHTKIYLWTHGWYGKETYIQKIIKKIFFRKVDVFFVYGDYAKQLMIKEGFNSDKLHVIKNSLDYDKQLEIRKKSVETNVYKIHFNNNNPILIFIGRLTPVKQLNMLIQAVANLKEKGEFYNLVFVGNGSERLSLEDLTNELKISNQVWFYGACYDEEKNAELIYNADLCVAPGNIGLTAMHSLMFGCPALTHDCFEWQMPEFESIIPAETGDFFEYRNQQSLERKISEWFKLNGSKRETIRKNCYKEIDTQWNPQYQIKILKKVLMLD